MSQKLRYRGLDSSGEGNDGEEEEHLLSEVSVFEVIIGF